MPNIKESFELVESLCRKAGITSLNFTPKEIQSYSYYSIPTNLPTYTSTLYTTFTNVLELKIASLTSTVKACDATKGQLAEVCALMGQINNQESNSEIV